MSDLHNGRVRVPGVHFTFKGSSPTFDVVAEVAAAIRSEKIPGLIQRAEPLFPQTRLLETQLAKYRRLAASSTVSSVRLSSRPSPGAKFSGVEQLAGWLEAVGDLPSSTEGHESYDAELVEAVKRFQTRHGLGVDGAIGPATRRALSIPAARRVRQIELALERLRWTPPLTEGPTILVNIPAFQLWAFDRSTSDRVASLHMSVAVGRAIATRTPVFAAQMTSVVFAPYWNVPRSIVVKELLPKFRSRSSRLTEESMEIIAGGEVLPVTESSLDLLEAGSAELRQRPGPENALGRVKFLFPNGNSVYFHETPKAEGFGAARRDFSHGCVRLEDPAGLARWVLQPQGWTAQQVDEALGSKAERIVVLGESIPVLLLYTTAVALNGTIYFYDDVYGHDARLERALMKGYPYSEEPRVVRTEPVIFDEGDRPELNAVFRTE